MANNHNQQKSNDEYNDFVKNSVNPNNNLGKQIAVAKDVVGGVYAIDQKGNKSIIYNGSPIYDNQSIEAKKDSSMKIQFVDDQLNNTNEFKVNPKAYFTYNELNSLRMQNDNSPSAIAINAFRALHNVIKPDDKPEVSAHIGPRG